MANEYVVRVAMLGSQAVGKTCIIDRFVSDEWKSSKTTVAAAFKTKAVRSPGGTFTIRFNIWDTAGQEIYKSVAAFYYKDADAIILVYDITQPKTFEALHYWHEEIKQHAPPHCLLSVMGNKCDLAETAEHNLDTAQAYAKTIHAKYYMSSAKTNTNITEVYMELAYQKYPELVQRMLNEERSKFDSKGKKNQNMRKSLKLSSIAAQPKEKKGCSC